MTALLEIKNLHKSYGDREILRVGALTLLPGHSYVLTGGNGAGKSTLLRILAGLESAQTGHFEFSGRILNSSKYPAWLRREVIYVHQQPYVFHTSVIDNISYGLKVRGIEKMQRQRLIDEALEWAGVRHLINTLPQKLSGGEKQRVALARAWVLNPNLFLLDEPTANLDDAARQQTVELIRRLCAEHKTVMIACHDKELIQLPNMHRLHLAHGQINA